MGMPFNVTSEDETTIVNYTTELLSTSFGQNETDLIVTYWKAKYCSHLALS
jgi:hypothetical protein